MASRGQLFTSSFQRSAALPRAVAIARRLHQYKEMPVYEPLRPSSEMLRLPGARFVEAYRAQLATLDPHTVVRELGEHAILICWERDPADCHRSLVAAWLHEAGYDVDEI